MNSFHTTAACILAALLAAACASEPAYAPPTQSEARQAYLRALRADWIDSPPPQPPAQPTAIRPRDSPSEAGRKAASVLEYESDLNSRIIARGLVTSFARITLGECSWTTIDADEAQSVSRPRLEGVGEGYRCAYEVFHDSAQRGRVSAAGSGYFFHRDGSYDFADIEQATFAPARQ